MLLGSSSIGCTALVAIPSGNPQVLVASGGRHSARDSVYIQSHRPYGSQLFEFLCCLSFWVLVFDRDTVLLERRRCLRRRISKWPLWLPGLHSASGFWRSGRQSSILWETDGRGRAITSIWFGERFYQISSSALSDGSSLMANLVQRKCGIHLFMKKKTIKQRERKAEGYCRWRYIHVSTHTRTWSRLDRIKGSSLANWVF